MDDTQQLLQFINLDRVPLAVVILVVGLLLMRLALGFLDDLGERFGSRRLLFKKISALLRFSVYLALFVITASSVLVLESEALLAVAGTVGVAVGFAFKDLLASLMAGVILLMDEPFQVGDRVAFGGYYGEITEIGLRSVRLVTLDDNLVTIPNNKFLNEASASANAGALDCMVVIPFYLGAAEDFVAARRLIEEATATSRYVFLDKPLTTLMADEFLGERFVTVIRVKAYVFDARYEKAFASDVTERVKLAFREAGLRTPDQQYRDLDMNHGREVPA
ncbi:MAG: mechanosensitive ion channel domain-containing protein [Myxococcota bacterium]|nr:mechanosensitive ion channel domain-containing protein [Myxococcota bacterium]